MTRLLVYAGPNGSGKSSLRDNGSEADAVDVVIDPDRIARQIRPDDPRAADRAAGVRALELFAETLVARRSMSLETTLAGHSILRRLRSAKAAGYLVELRYVALESGLLNVERVQARAAKGGHYIAPEVIARRRESSFANLPEAVATASRTVITDNSAGISRPVMEVVEGQIVTVVPDLPGWLRSLMPAITARLRPG